ncbi:MAG: hypothetical protein ABSB41_07920 [Anaerolineales bacterium]|jgi:hypothetical protein
MTEGPSSPRRGNWYLLTAALIGLGLGLIYAWVLSPVRYVDATPASLRADFKDQYRLLIASSYIATGDLGRAQARLALLKDADPAQALNAQAQRLLLAGDPNHASTVLIMLAEAIQPGTVSPTPASFPLPVSTVTRPAETATGATPIAISSPILRPSVTPIAISSPILRPSATPIAVSSPILHQSATPTSTPGEPFVVTKQEKVCDPSLASGLLQVDVRDAAGRGVPGVEILITWNGGQQQFFTGFKPQLGDGYADFTMTPGIVYNLQLAKNSAQVTGLSAPTCPGQAGTTYIGGLHLVFEQP